MKWNKHTINDDVSYELEHDEWFTSSIIRTDKNCWKIMVNNIKTLDEAKKFVEYILTNKRK